MQVEEYLKNHQPVIYKTFVNSFKSDKLSHAYLIVGNPGTPLYETAHYLAKTLLCDDPSPLACNSCITCLRVDDENYPDFIVCDGEKGTIKKEAVASIETMFDKEALESKGLRIYLLHLIENMTEEATNSILKFLEEPLPNIYAFLTTNNEENILPTIISRCQVFHLKSLDRKEVIKQAIDLGVTDEDAEFLSYFYNEPNLIEEITRDEDEYEQYRNAKDGLIHFFNLYSQDDKLESDIKKDAVYYAQKTLLPDLRGKDSMRFFLDMLSQILEDVVANSTKSEIILKSQKELINKLTSKIKNPSKILIEVLKDRSQLNININASLLLDHIIYCLIGE